MIKYVIKNIILVMFTVAVAVVAIWLPGYLLRREDNAEVGMMKDVSAEYYSGPSAAIIKNASRQLNSEERIQLITGVWESTVERVSESDCELTEFGIKTITLNRVSELSAKGLYPKSLSASFDDWYTWSAIPYRALDSTFQSYAAVFWDVRFTKYDGSEYHRFIVTESGDMLYANMTIGLGVDPENDVRKLINDFKPRLSNCMYLLNYYGDYSKETDELTTVTTYDAEVTSFRVASANDKEKENLDTENASRFIDGFTAFEPDQAFTLRQTNHTDIKTVDYIVCNIKTENDYSILLLPELESSESESTEENEDTEETSTEED